MRILILILLLFSVVSGYLLPNLLKSKINRNNVIQLKGYNDVIETKQFNDLQGGMKYRNLVGTDIKVSELCLGTMLYGEQVSKEDAFLQMDLAKSMGINFIDTAETYPVPSAPTTSGQSEEIIGQYLKKKGNSRNDFVISTKVCGHSEHMEWMRKDGGDTRINKKQLIEAVDNQLSRLGTDYIDLLQLYWPDRYTPLWGAPEYDYSLERPDFVSFKEQLEAIKILIDSGKVRSFGLSNETPYGLASFCNAAEMYNLPKPVALQNCYNLLSRNDFETGMSEACSPQNCNVGLLAYSPLAGGALTGKYLDLSTCSMESRMRKYVGYMHRYIAPPSINAVEAYMKVAHEFALPLEAISSAFVYSRPFVTSTIIGATSLDQLKANILALNLPIRGDLEVAINEVYRSHMDPSKGVFDVIDPNVEYVDPSKLPWGARDVDVDPELDILINQRLSKL